MKYLTKGCAFFMTTIMTNKSANNISKNGTFTPHPCCYFDLIKVDNPLERFDSSDFENTHKEDFRQLIFNMQSNEALYEIIVNPNEKCTQRTAGFCIIRIQYYKDDGYYKNVVMLRSLIKNEKIQTIGIFSFKSLGKFIWETLLNDFLDYIAETTQATMILGSFINNSKIKELFGEIYTDKSFRKPTLKERIYMKRMKIIPPDQTTLLVRNM